MSINPKVKRGADSEADSSAKLGGGSPWRMRQLGLSLDDEQICDVCGDSFTEFEPPDDLPERPGWCLPCQREWVRWTPIPPGQLAEPIPLFATPEGDG